MGSPRRLFPPPPIVQRKRLSIKYSLLTLLCDESATARQLQRSFEDSVAGWTTLNIGQVVQTLARLERDGLVHRTFTLSLKTGREVDLFHATAAGRSECERWWDTPLGDSLPARDGLVMRIALASARGASIPELVAAQREATQTHLRELLEQQEQAAPLGFDAPSLALSRRIVELEGIVRWLDLLADQPPVEPDREGDTPHD